MIFEMRVKENNMRKTFLDFEVRVWIEYDNNTDINVAANYVMVKGDTCDEKVVRVTDTDLLTVKASVVPF